MNLHKITFILLVIGGLNWGLYVLGYDLARYLSPSIMSIAYILIGLSAVYEIATHKRNCKNCMV